MSDLKNKIILITGGARSGKSDYAQHLAADKGRKVLFCATAEPLDDEMKARIEAHKKSRPRKWDTLEISRSIGASLEKSASGYDTVIIDCITLLVANCMADAGASTQHDQLVSDEITGLVDVLAKRRASYILVTNEAGSGLVPDNKLGRAYRDALGRANQLLAKCADEVYMMVAGLPVKIK